MSDTTDTVNSSESDYSSDSEGENSDFSELDSPPQSPQSKTNTGGHGKDGARKSQRPRLRHHNTVVTFHVGKSVKKYIVHKDFVCHHSPVLKAAFNCHFLEGQTQTYRFQETTHRAVRLLISWFYSQALPDLKYKNLAPEEEHHQDTKALVELWFLADTLLIPSLQNLAIKELEKSISFQLRSQKARVWWIPKGVLEFVFDTAEEDTGLDKLFVCFLTQLPPGGIKNYEDEIPNAVMVELVMALQAKVASYFHGLEKLGPSARMDVFMVEEN